MQRTRWWPLIAATAGFALCGLGAAARASYLAPRHPLGPSELLDAAVAEADVVVSGTVLSTTNTSQGDWDDRYVSPNNTLRFVRVAPDTWLKGVAADSVIGVGYTDNNFPMPPQCSKTHRVARGEKVVLFVRRLHPKIELVFAGAPDVHWDFLSYPYAGCVCDRVGGTDSLAAAVRSALDLGSPEGLARAAEWIVIAKVDTSGSPERRTFIVERSMLGISTGARIPVYDWNWRELRPGRYLLFLRRGFEGGKGWGMDMRDAFEILPAQGAPWNADVKYPAFGLTLDELTRRIEVGIKQRQR